MYTLQIDRNNNRIVCKVSVARNGYRVVFTGRYDECLKYKMIWVESVSTRAVTAWDLGFRDD